MSLSSGKDLKKIMYRLTQTNENNFTKKLDEWHVVYKDFEIPNTTNTLDGGTFSPLTILIKVHRGLGKSLKLKIVDDYLLNYKKKK